jgi:hypothetical protein
MAAGLLCISWLLNLAKIIGSKEQILGKSRFESIWYTITPSNRAAVIVKNIVIITC